MVKSSGMSSPNLYPHLPAVNFLLDFYVHMRTVIKSNINSNLRLHLGYKCDLYCTILFYLKQYCIKTGIPPLHSSPTMLFLWTQNEILSLEEDILFLCTVDNNLLLHFLDQHPDPKLSHLSYLWVWSSIARTVLHTSEYIPSSPGFKLPHTLFHARKASAVIGFSTTNYILRGVTDIYNSSCFPENFSCLGKEGSRGYVFLHFSLFNY